MVSGKGLEGLEGREGRNGVNGNPTVPDEKRSAIFPATLKLGQTHLSVDGKRIALAPGMNLTAEIKTGKRRVIDYLLSPVQKAADESMKER
jgi:hemolysin D